MITTAQYIISSPDINDCPKSNLPEYAFIGRSNVGKSSLINMLCHNPKLAKTSQKPGKTLLINHFLVQSDGGNKKREWHLVDLPGYGYAQTGLKQRDKLRRMIDRYCLMRQQLINLFVLIDCRHKPQQIDLDFMTWLGQNAIPFSIVFTKADKLSKLRLKENIEAYKTELLESWEELPPIFITSSENRMGGDELTAYIEQINDSLDS